MHTCKRRQVLTLVEETKESVQAFASPPQAVWRPAALPRGRPSSLYLSVLVALLWPGAMAAQLPASQPSDTKNHGTPGAASLAQMAPPAPAGAAPVNGGDLSKEVPAEDADGAASPEAYATIADLVSTARDRLGRACELQETESRGPFSYLACGDAGVWVTRKRDDGRYVVLAQEDLRGFVGSFFERGNQLWAELTVVQALPIATADGVDTDSAAPTAAPPPSKPPPSSGSQLSSGEPVPSSTASHEVEITRGHVVEVGTGEVVVDLGTHHAIRPGNRIAFRADTEDVTVGGFKGVSSRVLAVGEVTAVAATRSRVALGIGERVPLGTRALTTEKALTASSVAPPRLGDLWEAGFVARPFLVLDNLGGGALIDAYVGRRFAKPFHVQARLAPLGLATADDGATIPYSGYILASYDLAMFEAGLGLGSESVHAPPFDLQAGSGMALVQFVRLGAVDGLNLTAYSHVTLFHQEFDFSGLRIQGQIPLGGRTWLLIGGGAAEIGYGYGELGLRALVVGNGDRGSLFLTGVVGGATIFKNDHCFDFPFCEDRNLQYTGPMVGVGAEWRR